MPTTRAHYKHGEEVREKVNPKAREIIDKYPELFHFGVHGPDLLFYNDALKKNHVNQEGARLHSLPGRYFFENAVSVLEQMKAEESSDYKPALSYIYGFLCHFALDVCCHGYVQEKMDASGVSHTEIEAEMDREILVREGLDPVRTKLTGHLVPSGKNARVVSKFYEGISQEDVFKAMKDMVWFLNALVLPNKLARGLVYRLLKAVKQYDTKHGLIINYEKNEECTDSTERLLSLSEDAVVLATELIDSFPELSNDAFRFNFTSIDPDTNEKYAMERA
ncbi:MAG: zinc dependent phospholipase C family protein [Lachnospiraceae bacterium]|nr:zinc dependent phospholipase C family protein [Lachnospiraceae bacterium]